MSELIGACSLWWDAMFSLNAKGGGLVLFQWNVSDFVDSLTHWEPLLLEGVDGDLGWGGSWEGRELWMECKMKFKK